MSGVVEDPPVRGSVPVATGAAVLIGAAFVAGMVVTPAMMGNVVVVVGAGQGSCASSGGAMFVFQPLKVLQISLVVATRSVST